jgi:hypothetical protein
VSDDTDLGRLPDGHPSPEKLSAYQANELSPEEDDAIQEHVASCSLCAERLLELHRFLAFIPEDQPREGVADLETEAEWRKLRERIEKETERRNTVSPAVSSGFFRSAQGGYSVAAAFLAVAVALGVWNLSLVRKSREPSAVRTVRTLAAKESLRGSNSAETEPPVLLPAQITLDLPVETPESLYRVELFRDGSRSPERSLEVVPQGSELRILLPEEALLSGHYGLQVHGLRNGQPSAQVWNYELTVGQPRP